MTDDPRVLVQRGITLLHEGRFPEAQDCAAQALRLAPGSLAALNVLAVALSAQGRNAEAVGAFEALARGEPAVVAHWVNLGTALRSLGRRSAAVEAYGQAARLGEASADFFYNVGLLHVDRGDFEAARESFARAHALSPGDIEVACHLAGACVETLDTFEGLAALEGWQRVPGLGSELTAKIGNVLMSLGDLDGARLAFDRVLEDPSPGATSLVQLVLGLERANRTEEAGRQLEVLRSHPGRAAVESDFRLAEARLAQRAGRHEVAADLFRGLVQESPEPERRHFHQFPLARSLDALGRHEQAMSALLDAHASQVEWIRRTQPEVAARKRETMQVTRYGCDPVDVAAWSHEGAPSAEASPVFIVAFPRSGTTLLEHVLDAHPRLRTMDEQPHLQATIARLTGEGVHYPDRMAGLTRQRLDEARAHYWDLVRRSVALAAGEQLIDKNPLNILRLPVIVRLFPNARIVLAIRHPGDVLLSCFMQHFRAEFAWQCRDLDTLAVAWRRTFDYWYGQAALLQPAVHEVRYETFVTDFEAQVRELATFLELPWTDALLEPGANARKRGFISAPSYSQVVEPVHSRSVGRWHAYARWLDVARVQLEPYLERWQYAWPDQNSR